MGLQGVDSLLHKAETQTEFRLMEKEKDFGWGGLQNQGMKLRRKRAPSRTECGVCRKMSWFASENRELIWGLFVDSWTWTAFNTMMNSLNLLKCTVHMNCENNFKCIMKRMTLYKHRLNIFLPFTLLLICYRIFS